VDLLLQEELWHPKLQKCMALFESASDYIVVVEIGKEMLWKKQFL